MIYNQFLPTVKALPFLNKGVHFVTIDSNGNVDTGCIKSDTDILHSVEESFPDVDFNRCYAMQPGKIEWIMILELPKKHTT